MIVKTCVQGIDKWTKKSSAAKIYFIFSPNCVEAVTSPEFV